jgi:hypothetical protein
MNSIRTKSPESLTVRLLKASAFILLPALIGGCMASYGTYARDPGIFDSFNNDQVPLNYNYYYYHSGSFPIAVIGIEKAYNVNSKMWREVEPGTEEFKDLIQWIWEDYGYSRFAARINDPTGKQVGIMYTSIREVAIKFTDDDGILVIPHSPFLWGPAANSGGRYFGGTDANLFPPNSHRASNP